MKRLVSTLALMAAFMPPLHAQQSMPEMQKPGMMTQKSMPAETSGGQSSVAATDKPAAMCGKMDGCCCGNMSGGCECSKGMKAAMHSMESKGDESPASLALNGINQKMHRDMNISYSGNIDADFIKSMIPHHQGAIDMAKVVQAFGKDPQVRKLAEDVIKAQEAEIALMKEWLSKNGH